MDVKLVESLVISHIVNDQTYAIVIAQPNLHHQIGAIEMVDICRQSLREIFVSFDFCFLVRNSLGFKDWNTIWKYPRV